MPLNREEYKRAIDLETAARTAEVEAQVVNFGSDPKVDGRFLIDLKIMGFCDETLLEDGRVRQEGENGFAGDIVSIDATLEQVVVNAAPGQVPVRDRRLYLCPPDFLEVLRKFAEDNLRQGAQDLDARFERLAGEVGACVEAPWVTYPDSLLRTNQHAALSAAVSRGLTFVWGPPGTGKSYTLGHIAAYLRARGKRVLLLSHTNAAVDVATFAIDDACAQLKTPLSAGELIRYTSVLTQPDEYEKRPHLMEYAKLLAQYLAEEKKLGKKLHDLKRKRAKPHDSSLLPAEENDSEDAQEIATVMQQQWDLRELRRLEVRRQVSNCRIHASTITRAMYKGFLSWGGFDIILVDEASLLPLAVWPYLLHDFGGAGCPRFVIAGDPLQLSPVGTRTSGIPECGRWFDGSLYSYLGMNDYEGMATGIASGAVVFLNEQSRMRAEICRAVSQRFYHGLLVGERLLPSALWAEGSNLPEAQIVLLEVPPESHRRNECSPVRNVNMASARKVEELIGRMIGASRGDAQLDVLVLSPYRKQVAQVYKPMLKALEYRGKTRLRASTVHRCQGAEADIVIFDTVAALSWFVNRSPGAAHLWCVACSRAKLQLYIVGDSDGLCRSGFCQAMFGSVPTTTL